MTRSSQRKLRAQMQITPATLDDAQKILALQHLAYQTEAALYDDDTLPPLLDTLDDLACPVREPDVPEGGRRWPDRRLGAGVSAGSDVFRGTADCRSRPSPPRHRAESCSPRLRRAFPRPGGSSCSPATRARATSDCTNGSAIDGFASSASTIRLAWS